nr:immunoglobulin light chain junction region [Macaca mulatta]MOV79374.1 immunoglobulin light chain junction region [Macaca mulatta]MOV79917.1 immunoglobulin light chain junction region [Macaca mulatta]MOV80442.1 immunoglobulin light chain junction region [Macaca mulatta]MOV80805.1 immunoglobulin light chain junction region [Macaca mulatta]
CQQRNSYPYMCSF